MADEIRKIDVRIGGMSYQLVSAENEQYTRQVAAKADEMIRRVMQNNPQLSQNMSAILALINALDELARIRQQFGTLDDQRQHHDKQLAEIRTELTRLREQNWDMKKEILRQNALCRDYEALLEKQPAVPAPETAEKLNEKPAEIPAAETAADDQPKTLTQTNLEDYLRENGWPQSTQPRHYDCQP